MRFRHRLQNAEGGGAGGGGGGAGGGGGNGGAGAGGGGSGGGGSGSPWYGQVPADRPQEFRDWIGTKAFKDPITALESAWNTEKLVGVPADQIIRLPKPTDDAKAWEPVWNRLGRPEKPEGYELPLPQGDDGTFAKTAAAWFHGAGVPKAAAQAIAKQWNDHVAKLVDDGRKADETKATQALDALKGEWGADFDKRSEFGRRGLKTYGEKAGLDANDITALEQSIGTAKMLKLFHALGETTGEHGFGGGGNAGGGSMTPAAAKAKLDELRQARIENKITQEDYLKQSDLLAPIAAKA